MKEKIKKHFNQGRTNDTNIVLHHQRVRPPDDAKKGELAFCEAKQILKLVKYEKGNGKVDRADTDKYPHGYRYLTGGNQLRGGGVINNA